MPYAFFQPKNPGIYDPEYVAESSTMCTLTIYFEIPYAYLSNVTIFNERLERVALPEKERRDSFTRIYKLPVGRYTIRIEINCLIKDTVITLNKDKTCTAGYFRNEQSQQLGVPLLYSAALIDGKVNYASTLDYYSAPAVSISEMRTLSTGLSKPDDQSGLFIFLRYPSKDIYQDVCHKESYWERFILIEAHSGEQVAHFPQGCITDNNKHSWNLVPGTGYLGFSANLQPGMYYLVYTGHEDPRMIPIYIYENWYTQFFMTVAEKPQFGSIRIFISAQKKYDTTEENHVFTDILLCKIMNNDFALDKLLLENIARGKYRSPMLGLLGAYMYLSSKESSEDWLFTVIAHNLENNILKTSDSPDIWALNLLGYRHFKKTLIPTKQKRSSDTPMLRIAYDVIKESAAIYRGLVPTNSLNDLIATHQCVDSPFNTFRPIPVLLMIPERFYSKIKDYRKGENERIISHDSDLDEFLEDQDFIDEQDKDEISYDYEENEIRPQEVLDQFKRHVIDEENLRSDGRFTMEPLVYAILKLLMASDYSYTDREIAERLSMPQNTIKRKIAENSLREIK